MSQSPLAKDPVTPRGESKRHVEIFVRLIDEEANGHDVEKWWIGQRRAAFAELVRDGELQFITASGQRAAGDDVGPSVAIGHRFHNAARLIPRHVKKLNG